MWHVANPGPAPANGGTGGGGGTQSGVKGLGIRV